MIHTFSAGFHIMDSTGATYVTGMDASDMTLEQLCGLWMPLWSVQTPEQKLAAEKLVADREQLQREKAFEKIKRRLSKTVEGRAKLADLQRQRLQRPQQPEPPKAEDFPPYWWVSKVRPCNSAVFVFPVGFPVRWGNMQAS
jgi:hypothetical protein